MYIFCHISVNLRHLTDQQVVQLVKIIVANNPLTGDTLPLATSDLVYAGIRHANGNNCGRKSVILNLIQLSGMVCQISGILKSIVGHFRFDWLKNAQDKSLPRPHVLFYSSGVAIWHGFFQISDISQLIRADNRPFWIWSNWFFLENIST